MADIIRLEKIVVVCYIFLLVACGIITTYNRGGFMATNAYGQNYVGNDDFRGWVAAGNYSNPTIASNSFSDSTKLLDYVGNDGKTGSQDAFIRSATERAYQEWKSGRVEQQQSAPAQSGGYNGGYDDGGAAARAAAAEAAKRAKSEAAISNTRKAIGSLDTELDTAYDNISGQKKSITSGYNKESVSNEADYDGETVNNNQSLLKNKQNSLQAGAQGARGLRSTLASIGALGGTGLTLANRAVTNSVNQDLGEASETAAGNAMTLDKAIKKFRDEDEDRRKELDTQSENQRTAAEGRVLGKKQGYFEKLADLFGDLGNSDKATEYLDRAGDLNDPIAKKTAVASTPFTKRAAAFTPGALADYLAGTGDMTVSTSAGDATGMGTSPSSILAGRREDKKKQNSQVFA